MSSVNFPRRLLLLLIPLYCIVVSVIFLKFLSPFYISQPDPCYCYLFNGLNLASGNMEIGHIDHPGTTVQCFAAVVIFIKHLFSSPGVPLVHDVIINSESYLITCSVLLISLFVCINYLTGVYIFRHTGHIGMAILFQLAPLINIGIIHRIPILGPESFIISATPFFMAYLFIRTSESETGTSRPLSNKTVILFALFTGFLIATKYTCIPVIVLVLFLLKNGRQRLLYIGATVLSFTLFIIPALPKLNLMFQWVWELFTHDGIYGQGNAQVINPSSFTKNLKDLFLTDAIFTSFYIVITLAFITALTNSVRKKNMNVFFRAISGTWLAITALILAVAKHCDFHYLIFAECCFPLGLVMSYKVFSGYFTSFMGKAKTYKNPILYTVFISLLLFLVIEKIRYIPFHYSRPASIDSYVEQDKTTPLIISIKDDMASRRKEPALYLGYMYSGSLQAAYAPFLKELYPNTYIYWGNSSTLVRWGETIPTAEFSAKNNKALVYLIGYGNEAGINILHKVYASNANLLVNYSKQALFSYTERTEDIYLVTCANE